MSASAQSARPAGGGWWPVTAMMLCSLLSYLDRQALAVLAPTIVAALAINAQRYAEAISAFSLVYMCANPVWGALLDRVGLRWGMAAAVLAWSLASGSHAWVYGFGGLVAARMALGLGEAATFPGCLRAAVDSLPPERQARGLGWAYAGGSLGAVLTPIIVTPVAQRYGWRAAFLVTATAGFAWLVMWMTSVRPARLARARRTDKFTLPNPRQRRFWAVVTSYGIGVLPLGVVFYLGPLYLAHGLGLSQARVGELFWIPPLGWIAGGLLWGWLCDRYPRLVARPLGLYLALAACGLPVAAMTHVHSTAWVLVLLTDGVLVGAGFIVTALRVALCDYPPEQAAMVGGIASGSWSAMLALTLPIMGRLFDSGRYETAFLATALFPLLAALTWRAVAPRRGGLESNASPLGA